MDIKVLSFGESISGVLNDKSFLSSNCYFEWINLKSFNSDELSNNIFDFKAIEHMRNNISDCFHLQDSLLLVSDDEPNTNLEKSSHIYVSLINLPMWNEKIVKDSLSYVEMRNDIKRTINSMICQYEARLYSAFEYCDYVLLCDASKITLTEYLKLINEIRGLVISFKKNDIRAIHNVITIYGYTENTFAIDSVSTEKLSLTVGMSFKDIRNVDNFKTCLNDKKITSNIAFASQVFGQYDYIVCWKDISCEFFNEISTIINTNRDFFLNWRFYIGSSEENVELAFNSKDYDNKEELEKSKLTNLGAHNFDFLKKAPFGNQLFYAINDIDLSLKHLLDKGLAQYYILSFYESFYSFISFLKKISQKYVENAETNIEEDTNKEITEKIFDMFRTYFGVLNALNECTTHSRKQFLQIAPCQMMYFDAPPKLIAFYTAVINRIVRNLNFDIKDKYTFLITPDFKKDIYVDSLTEDKTLGDEHNLLIIHMSEESMYNIVQSLKIVMHEIFHHIGQTKALRRKRSQLYLKCCLAKILANVFPDNFLNKIADGKKYKFFVDFVDELYLQLFTDKEHFFPMDEWFNTIETEHGIDEVLYYSDFLFDTFTLYMEYCFNRKPYIYRKIYIALNNLYAKGYNLFDCEFWETNTMSEEDKDVLKEFELKNLSFEIQNLMINWLARNNTKETYSEIMYIFRESFADARMLMLVSDENNRLDIYEELFGAPVSLEDSIRKASIVKFFGQNNAEQESQNQFDILLTLEIEIEDNPEDLYYLYLRDKTVDYLLQFEEPKSSRYTGAKTRINEIFNALNNNNVGAIIDKMDEEIFSYRKLLSEKDDD